ncbi:MAG: response regulator transcription factor [Rubrivivax sp.]|nr:response regulator transcription factor [Rubrivivax sp.]
MRLLIVDDEALARLRLRQVIEAIEAPRAQVVGEAATVAEAQAELRRLGEGGVDAMLLDVGLPGPSGIALAAAMRTMSRPPAVIFVTAHAEHALQAFELQALDYLTKPVRSDRLRQALERVARWTRSAGGGPATQPTLVLNERGRVLRLPHDEILSLRADHKAVVVRTATGSYVVDEVLGELEERLGGAFLRVHRNALVARSAIRALELRPGLGDEAGADGWAVLVAAPGSVNGEWVAVSRRQVATVKAALAGGGSPG